MTKPPVLHPYSDRTAFDRLLLLIATLVHHPGVGSRSDKTTPDQDSLESLQQHLQAIAADLAIPLPQPSVHTLRKDLVTLRQYRILERQRHDWGYYLGTGALHREELQVAFNALAAQAQAQGHPHARRIYERLQQRLKPLNLECQGELFYPVRAQWNRAIMQTDPAAMLARRESRQTLFHRLAELEAAIMQGQAIELYQRPNPYTGQSAYRQVYPLQLLYYDIAWYLVTEDVADGFFAISRLDRFTAHLHPLSPAGRGLAQQQQQLQTVQQLLVNGWGLNLGDRADQAAELQGTLPLTLAKVRFFPPILTFIQEGERRHPRQQISLGPRDAATGQLLSVDYKVKLPPRSLPEFGQWVNRYLDGAQILAPASLAQSHQAAAQRLVERYS